MGFFDKIKQGLTKTKTKMDAQLTGIFAAYEPGDEEFFEDLEETLILADTGVETTTKAIAQLRKAIELKKLRTGAEVKKEFVQILTRILKVQDTMLLLTTQPSVVLVVGVNGVGKTTTIGKLAAQLKKEGNRVLLSAADTFRAAAADQLTVWAQRAGVDIVKHEEGSDPAAVVFDSIQAAKARGTDVVIIDTAGRLHNKTNLMNELNKITRVIRRELPEADIETLMVLDATTGQNGLIQAKQFLDTADLTGIVLTKLDGDTRGGAALSIRTVVNKPIMFVGTGEKLDAVDQFHPARMADRILGMGDIVSLVERAQEQYDEEEAERLQKKIQKNQFDFNDFLTQIHQIKKMGNLKELASMIPGVGKAIKDIDIDDNAFKSIEAIIYSMTPEERTHPEILNGTRRTRIAKGSGTSIQEVNRLLKQFDQTRKMMKMVTGSKMAGMMQKMKKK